MCNVSKAATIKCCSLHFFAELKDTNAELAEENSSLRCYMEKLLSAVINYSPEILEIAPSE